MTDELDQPTMEELLELRARLKNYHSDEDGSDTTVSICEDPRFMDDADTSNMEPLRRWVKFTRAEISKEGGIMDTGMRCVLEGGDIVYLDPEIISDLMDQRDVLEGSVLRLSATVSLLKEEARVRESK